MRKLLTKIILIGITNVDWFRCRYFKYLLQNLNFVSFNHITLLDGATGQKHLNLILVKDSFGVTYRLWQSQSGYELGVHDIEKKFYYNFYGSNDRTLWVDDETLSELILSGMTMTISSICYVIFGCPIREDKIHLYHESVNIEDFKK